MVSALITWGIFLIVFGSGYLVWAVKVWRAFRSYDPTRLGTVYTIESPYYDYLDKRAAEVNRLTFPGTRFVVACRRSPMTWTAYEYLSLGPEMDPLTVRINWGASRKHCLNNLSKDGMEPEARLLLTQLVMAKTMSPAVMNSIAKVMKEIG